MESARRQSRHMSARSGTTQLFLLATLLALRQAVHGRLILPAMTRGTRVEAVNRVLAGQAVICRGSGPEAKSHQSNEPDLQANGLRNLLTQSGAVFIDRKNIRNIK